MTRVAVTSIRSTNYRIICLLIQKQIKNQEKNFP